jgi:hypothetical protein
MYNQQSEYPDEYATPSTSRDEYQSQWEQPRQESQPSQVSDQMSRQAFEQTLEQPQQHITSQHIEPLSLPPPPQRPYQQELENPQHLVPTQIPPRGTYDPTPIRLHPPGNQPPVRSPVEIQPVTLQTRPTASSSRQHRHHPYATEARQARQNFAPPMRCAWFPVLAIA